MYALVLLSDLFFLLLFARACARRDDRAYLFNPYLLWSGRLTDPVGRFTADILPGLPVRGGCGVALLFLLAFRGALLATRMPGWSVTLGATLAFHPRPGWAGALAFSVLDFAVFLARFWGLALLTAALAAPGEARSRIGQALDALATPFARAPLWARILLIVAAHVLLAPLLHHLAGAGLAAPNGAGFRTDFDALFLTDTRAHLAAAYAGVALLSLLDVLAFLRGALVLAIFASLLAAILQNRTLATFFLELQNHLLGRFARRSLSVGMFDFAPILFFIALNFLYALLVALVIALLRHFGILAAGALAAQHF